MHEQLISRIDDRSAVVAVVGLGYVGLPLAVALAETGFRVVGIDVDEAKVAAVSDGRSPIVDIDSARVGALTDAGLLSAEASYSPIGSCDVVFVCVPTPFDAHKTPDLRFVNAAVDGVAPGLRAGQLIVLQSTTYPGTTEEVARPRLERSGLRAGVDFFLAFSPERVDPGVPNHTVENTPKVVGGVTRTCGELAARVLRTLGTQALIVSSPRVAEMTKLLENIFRAVNIALVNELALLCERMSIDVWEVIEAASTKPFGFMPFRPGAGVGGHCIPVDPHYLAWKAREYDFTTRFIELAAEINSDMPHHVLELTSSTLNKAGRSVHGASVLVLGVAFKPNVDDPRHSPAVRFIELLLERGAQVRYHDPYIGSLAVGGSVFHRPRATLHSVELTDAEIDDADVVVLVTAHDRVDHDRVAARAALIVDTTNTVSGAALGRVVRLGAPVTSS